ncbi:hypothetical protein AB3S75_031329 [Citrus x aurantiifolia]
MAEQSAKQSSVQLREKRSRKKVSDAWAHSTRCDGEPRAACNYCGEYYPIPIDSKLSRYRFYVECDGKENEEKV